MNFDEIREWILAISAAATMLSIAAGIWLSLREYRLKLQAESRQERSSTIESEIRLNTLFTKLMGIANGRSGYVTSEKAIEHYMKENTPPPLGDLKAWRKTLSNISIVALPVGAAEQDASVAAIYTLTLKYPELRQTGLRALQSLNDDIGTDAAKLYLKKAIRELDQ